MDENESFWSEQMKQTLTLFVEPRRIAAGSFRDGNITWFEGAKLNVCYNCVDRHLPDKADKTALIWEGNQSDKDNATLTYSQLQQQVCRLANVLKRNGVRKGDSVAIYMPMVMETAVAMLACARIGAVHTVIFAGFSPTAIHDRVVDAHACVVLCSDEGVRGPKRIPLKDNVDEAVRDLSWVRTVLVHKRTGGQTQRWVNGRDEWLHEAMARESNYCPCEWMDAEDPLFYLYTSGSTGRPKGIVHTQAGYLLYASVTQKLVFDVRPDDIYACMADMGWITGHSYILYGPLANGCTSLIFEPTPLYPDAGRYWHCVEKHKITQFYTSPTAIRALMKFGTEFVKKYNLSSLRVLGSVGEPINPAAWQWYHENVGMGRCAIVDTFWQTETGGHLITTLPGAHAAKPGCAATPFFGIEPVLLDPISGAPLVWTKGESVTGLLCMARPWPGIGRTIYGDHERYLRTYMSYPGFYFTGDSATKDADGYIWINGRVDDVLNVSGHRLGTAELENALVNHVACPEAAVIAVPHELKGQCVYAFCVLREGYEPSPELRVAFSQQVVKEVGAFARPEAVILCAGLPKTRSGKIMRRLLRKIAERDWDNLGDTSTLADPSLLQQIIDEIKAIDASRKK